MDDGNGKHEEQVIGHHKCTVVTVVYDHETCLVSLGMKDIKIGLAQMMIDEAGRQLEYMRRVAQLQEMQQQAVEQARVQALLEQSRGRR